LSMFEGTSLTCFPNFWHQYLGSTELPRKVIVFKIMAMNPKKWKTELNTF
jgi:hypothetical protein